MLIDKFERKFEYLRLSVTNICNFKCQYCLPNGYNKEDKGSELSLIEIENLIEAFAELGVWKVRLTGGEPSTRSDLNDIAKLISSHKNIKKTCITTNGYNLRKNSDDWIKSGITDINVSIDSLNESKFHAITGKDILNDIIETIDYLKANSKINIKINSVIHKFHDIYEIESFLNFIKNRDISLRFIELMQTGDNLNYFKNNHQKSDFIKKYLIDNSWLELKRKTGDGPAVVYSKNTYKGKIGIIAPYAKDFCTDCNRLRVDSVGNLKLCLFGDTQINLRHLLQHPSQKNELKSSILESLNLKPKEHTLTKTIPIYTKNLSVIGG